MQAALVLRSLRRDYNERPVLREVSIEVQEGQTLTVIGPNGAGKSTLLRILATLLRPSAGGVEVLGAGLPGQAWKVRGRIGYLGHEPLLYRELSIRENLEFNARLQGVEPAGERIDSLLEAAGLAHLAGELVRNLSAGMLQRAAICRALLPDPALLLLDEPRSHLDLGAAAIVDELLGPAPGRARVVVTHEIESGLAEADQVLALRADGSVAHSGAAAGLTLSEARAVVEGNA
ncbi:MAG: heme exporter protein [Solirubrobacterales bacterium]|jgi:heme exporter protein A|nr:heme exporter protein [Solirubrobacterales bacterium]